MILKTLFKDATQLLVSMLNLSPRKQHIAHFSVTVLQILGRRRKPRFKSAVSTVELSHYVNPTALHESLCDHVFVDVCSMTFHIL